mmetsp:Transcript_67815/g.159095  ORF Transcript_67815/g.159095 Transcript_67815/m.159095 type:complete len:326 (+) Transcript_67815:324-1301(+)
MHRGIAGHGVHGLGGALLDLHAELVLRGGRMVRDRRIAALGPKGALANVAVRSSVGHEPEVVNSAVVGKAAAMGACANLFHVRAPKQDGSGRVNLIGRKRHADPSHLKAITVRYHLPVHTVEDQGKLDPFLLDEGPAVDRHSGNRPSDPASEKLQVQIGMVNDPLPHMRELPFRARSNMRCKAPDGAVDSSHAVGVGDVDLQHAVVHSPNTHAHALHLCGHVRGLVVIDPHVSDHLTGKKVLGNVRCVNLVRVTSRLYHSHGQVDDIPVGRLPIVVELGLCIEHLRGGEDGNHVVALAHRKLVAGSAVHTAGVELTGKAVCSCPL